MFQLCANANKYMSLWVANFCCTHHTFSAYTVNKLFKYLKNVYIYTNTKEYMIVWLNVGKYISTQKNICALVSQVMELVQKLWSDSVGQK